MATVRKFWRCTNSQCKNEKGKHRGYKKVCLGEKTAPACKHCGVEMVLSNNYTTRIMKAGKTHTKATGSRKADAETHVAACLVARASGSLIPGEEPLIYWDEAVKTFTKWAEDAVANKELSADTATYYKNGLKPLKPAFKDKALQEIEKQMIEDFKTKRATEVTASTVNMSLATIKRLYTIITDQLRARNYPRLHEAKEDVFKVKLLELNNTPDDDVILETEEEMQALLDECKTPHLHHFAFGILNTGLRHQFMWSLKTNEIFMDRNEIVKKVKGGKVVIIPLTQQYREYLTKWLKEQKVKSINHYVIPSRLDPTKCYKADSHVGFPQACERVAAKYEKGKNKKLAAKFRQLTPHHLRHTFATHFLYKTSKELGATVAVHILAKILGHSSTYITERYSHVLNEINQGAMKAYGEQMFQGGTK